MSCTPAFCQDSSQLFQLALCTKEGTEPFLRQFPRLLILVVPQQLHNTSLVRGKANDLSDDTFHERIALLLDAFPLCGLQFLWERSESTAFVITDADATPLLGGFQGGWSHCLREGDGRMCVAVKLWYYTVVARDRGRCTKYHLSANTT